MIWNAVLLMRGSSSLVVTITLLHWDAAGIKLLREIYRPSTRGRCRRPVSQNTDDPNLPSRGKFSRGSVERGRRRLAARGPLRTVHLFRAALVV